MKASTKGEAKEPPFTALAKVDAHVLQQVNSPVADELAKRNGSAVNEGCILRSL